MTRSLVALLILAGRGYDLYSVERLHDPEARTNATPSTMRRA